VENDEPRFPKTPSKKQEINSRQPNGIVEETMESKKKVSASNLAHNGPNDGNKASKEPGDTDRTENVVAGVNIQDVRIGTGVMAQKGSKIYIRYVGKVKNGTVFDWNTNGNPLSFSLGEGDTIKGLDVGLVGMHVGGVRTITVPANMGYGSKRLPGIPPNSVLVFDGKAT
jgi:FK506-binding nuclear protein